jgi:hypothetical protein
VASGEYAVYQNTANGAMYVWDLFTTAWVALGGATIARAKAQLSADVTMTSANTGYDGPSITPVAGTHTIWANVTVENTTGAGTFTAKLWDGTTVLASGGFTAGGATYVGTIPLLWEVVASGSTAYKVTVLCNVTGGLIKAAVPVNGAGNNATTIYSLQVA